MTDAAWQPGDPVYPDQSIRAHCGPCLVAWTAEVDRCWECGELSTEALRARIAELEQSQPVPRVWLPGALAEGWTQAPDGTLVYDDDAHETCKVTGAGCDPSYAWSAPRLAKMLDEIREALDAPIDATHAEVLARIGLLVREPRVWLPRETVPPPCACGRAQPCRHCPATPDTEVTP